MERHVSTLGQIRFCSCYGVAMFSRNPNRASGMVMKSNANVAATAFQPNTQQLYDMLRKANDKIAELERRLLDMERAIYISPAGDVEICAPTQVRIVAGAKVDIQSDHSVEIRGGQGIQLRDQNGNSVQLTASGITNNAAARHQTNAGIIDASAGAMNVNAGQSQFSGVVKCDTLIANSVVGSSYTPGAGNVW